MMQTKFGRVLAVFGAVAMLSGTIGVSSAALAQAAEKQLYAQAPNTGMPNLEGTWVGRTAPNGETFFYRTQLKLANQEGEFIQGTLTWEVSSNSSNVGVFRVNGRIYPADTEEGPGWQLVLEGVNVIDDMKCQFIKNTTLTYVKDGGAGRLIGWYDDYCTVDLISKNDGNMELTRQ